MPRNNMPEDWDPPAPAWSSEWQNKEDPLVTGYYGIQSSSPNLLEQWASVAFTGNAAPFSVEKGKFTDQIGTVNYLYIAYWRLSDYQQWWPQHSGWWSDDGRLTEGVGYWREVITMPFDRFETLHSTEHQYGVGVSADGMHGPIKEHGYPGGARDRIPLSSTESLITGADIHAGLQTNRKSTESRVVVVPPEGMCTIRSGQDWTYCGETEKTHYLGKLHPVLIKGMSFLTDNPEETNCYSMRFIDNVEDDWGDMEQTFGLGYATDIYAFENWAKSHPTHLAIFDGFLNMVDTFGQEMRLRLWHEVVVLPKQGCEFEYISCHEQTGLLPYAGRS